MTQQIDTTTTVTPERAKWNARVLETVKASKVEEGVCYVHHLAYSELKDELDLVGSAEDEDEDAELAEARRDGPGSVHRLLSNRSVADDDTITKAIREAVTSAHGAGVTWEMGEDTIDTTDNTHAMTCTEMDCDECMDQDRARIRAIDAVRYPWASPERLEMLRDELLGMLSIFDRGKRGRSNAKNVLVVHVVSTRFDFLPYFSATTTGAVEAGPEAERSAGLLPAGHPTAAYLRSGYLNRVLILWDRGQLAAYRLPDSEGTIGFKLLVPDATWLEANQ